jgi:serine/threonine-protein kinase
MLYEMLAGEPPFSGPNAMAIMARHAMEAVPSIRIVRPSVPEEVEEAILAAMEKHVADRPKTAADFCEILGTPLGATATRRVTGRHTARHRVPTGARLPAYTTEETQAPKPVPLYKRPLVLASTFVGLVVVVAAVWMAFGGPPASAAVGGMLDVKKVAVLYFDDLTPDKKLGYLADGLTETLIDQLKQVDALRDVISKEGVGRFRGKNAPNDSIAKALQVGTIVMGSVAQNGDRVGITIRVIDGNSAADVKNRGWDLPQSDPIALRNAVADSVASFLKDYLGEEIRLRELRLGTNNAIAFTLVQRAEKLRKDALAAVAARDSATAAQSFAAADSMLAEAERQDARWASPAALRSGIALARAQSWRNPLVAGPRIQEGLAHATRAITLDSTNASAWENRGRLRYLTWTSEIVTTAKEAQAAIAGAEADLVKATEYDKSRASAWSILSNVRSDRDDFTGAKLAAQRAWDEDAFQTNVEGVLWNLYRTSYNLEQAVDASKWCKEGFTRFPKNRAFVRCRLWLRTMSAIPPNVDSAWADAQQLVDLTPPAGVEFAKRESRILVGAALARAGKADSGRSVLLRAREGVDEKIDPEHNLMGFEAFIRTLFNDPEDTGEAFAILRRYVSGNPAHREGLAKTQSWWWRPLIGDQRWKDLVAGR